MLPGTDVRWCAVPPNELACREWDGELVVFDQNTGSTHLLNELGGEVLHRLIAADRGETIDSLAAALSDDPAETDKAALIKAVGEVLSEFARLGLAHPDTT